MIPDADRLSRPLLLVHGLADDNVVTVHTLRLSATLLAVGRPHNVLPLSGATHLLPGRMWRATSTRSNSTSSKGRCAAERAGLQARTPG
ncbi:alpha/beta hydrolase family protein [Streptomyces sp. NPDC093546]|uniref:alpha/beta hydrolase family protein n=1 Tax=Streptomyces sp. NPDC093546 TaxID=3366040 RepID=UPI0038235A6D